MKSLLFLATFIFATRAFACEDNFNGKFVGKNSGSNVLEIKVLDCSPKFELSFPAENRTGHVVADNVDRVIFNAGGRKVSEMAFVKEDALTIKIVDKHVFDIYYQNQIYKLTPKGLDLYIEIYNTNRSYDYKKHIYYDRE